MNVSQDVLNYGILSELAYLKLENGWFTNNNKSWENPNDVKQFINNNPKSVTGIDDDRKSVILSLLDAYTIVDFTTMPSGMQAMLLRGSGGYTVAFRGTETADWSELLNDVGSDAEMAIGHEIPQMRDALAYVQMLKTTGVQDHSNNDAIVKINSSTVLTGHSLGGALAQYVSFKTGYEAYTYNGFGIRKGEGIIGAGGDTSRIHNFHLGIDFVSGIGSRIGGQPGGQVFEATRDVLEMIPNFAVSRISQILIGLGSLITAATINSTIDNITGSFLGGVTNITPYDSSSIGDYGQDHSIVEMNKALHLYQTYLSPIFASNTIETINLEMASIAALPYEYIAQSPYRVLSTNGMPKVLELMGYALLGKPMSNGSRYDTYANTEAFLTQLKSAVTTNGGIEVLAFDFDSPDALFNAALGSKPLQYALVNNLPLIVYKNAGASLYAEFDGSYMSHTQLKDIASMTYYMEHPKAGKGIGTEYENKETDVIAYNKEAAIDKVIFGKNDQDEEETLQGLSGDDSLYGNGGDDTLIGDSESGYVPDGDDWLEGGAGADILKGGGGDDFLIGGYAIDKVDDRGDYMMGGSGDDMYYSGNFDIIKDDKDGEGSVYFDGVKLTGGTSQNKCNTSHQYFGDGGVYTFSGGVLTFKKDGKILTIQNFKKTEDGYLSIILKDPKSDSCPHPVQPCFPEIPLPTPILKVTSSDYTPKYGGKRDIITYTPSTPSTPHTKSTPATPIYICVNEPYYNSTGIGGGGGSTGPIVLDLNRNGITSISLSASTALFDYDGDEVVENTAWIEGGDALLVSDTNNDGLINNASELFGNYTKNSDGSIAKSGYQALSYYDTNSDNIVDATDTRFEELKLWIDANGDGVTDAGELKTLSEMGVTSLTLNDPSTPYLPTVENTNTIIQETTFTDAQGEGIMRDVLFRYENTSANTDGVYFDMDANGIKEKMTTWTDPNEWMVVKDINGDGKINNGSEIVGNNMILNTGTTASDTIQALKTFDINHDGKVDAADNSGLAFWTDRNHNGITDVGELEALGAAGAIQTIKLNPYQTLLSVYTGGEDGVIDAKDNLAYYLYIQTNTDGTINLYLPDNDMARDMIEGYIGGESIQTSQGEKIIKSILFYEGYSMDLKDTLDGTDASEILTGSSRGETLRGKGGRDILNAGAGDDILEGGTGSDKLMGGAGDDTYVFNRGDGKDLIIDSAGTDTISFSAGISKDDLIIKSNGIDISIYLKDGTKTLSQLTDQIIIKDWHTTGTVKTIAFSDGSSMDGRDIVTMFSTDKNDTIYGTENSETLSGGEGNDVVQGRGGSDIYLYGREDGRDTIIDSGGFDTLSFGAGISVDDLIVKKVGNDIIIGVKENGVVFENLADTVTLKNWYTVANRIERFSFADEPTVNESWIIEMLDNVDDVIYGTDASEVFSTFGGDDTVYAGGGDDILIGGKGNDTLYGEAGNNTIDGDVGDDSLFGGVNDDIYIFGRGYGKDTIQESTPGMAYTQGNDTLKFVEGITTSDLVIKQIGNDLLVGLKEEGKTFDQLNDVVTMKNWSSNTTRLMSWYTDLFKVENFVFSDGTIWNQAEIVSHIGTDEDDVIYGSESNDILQGGKGNDSIYGLTGDDVYHFNRGDGQDTIYDTAQDYYSGGEYNSGNDVLKFGEEITADDLIIQKSGKNLIVAIKENGVTFEALQDKVILNNWFSVNNRIETFMFCDGSTMDTAFLLDGSDGDDYLTFGSEENTVYLSDGNDILYAGAGNDKLYGEVGNDSLYGETGNDTLDGGSGVDKLYGGFGDDIYIFGRGYGKDVVEDAVISSGSLYSGGTNDTLKFIGYIGPEDILIIQSGYDLLVGIKEEGKTFDQLSDVIKLSNWSRNTNSIESMNGSLFERYGIENFVFEDGTVWKKDQIVSHIGTDENDTIYGLDGADTLHGGKGDDILYGRPGDDTYLFNRGDGKDVIFDTSWQGSSAGNDTLKLGEGITQNDLIFKRVNTDLIVALKEEGVAFDSLSDMITLQGWYNFNTRVETFMFSDGSVMDTAFLDAATEQDDYIIRGSQNDIVDALGGNDTIYTGSGNDILIAGTGNDLLYGETGDDTLDGGTGNDTLQGGQGNDTYRFGRGDGHDVFDDYSNNGNGFNDILQFKEGIYSENILIKQIGNNLVVGIKEEGKTFDELSDKITIIDWSDNRPLLPELMASYGGHIESFTFADGTIWTDDDIVAHIGTDGDDAIYGWDGADTLHGGKGTDSLYGTGGNDTYIFNRGDGRDVVYDANYTYDAGNDTLKFGEGITVDDLIAQASVNGNDLIIGLKENTKLFTDLVDTVTLRNWSNVNNRIENIVLFDGTTLDVNDVVKLQQTNGDDLMMGTEQNNTFEGKLGNDTLYGGAGNDTYIFNRGDGVDNVNDLSGKVYVRFGAGITTESIIVRAVEKNIIIALTEEGKSFDELSDKVILSNSEMMNIESIIFDNGKILSSADLINLESSEAQDTVVGTINNDTIDGGQGNDSMSGGAGNDTYIFNRGDGLDSIDDFSGADTLKLGQGISADDLILKAFSDNNNLIIALKEEGKTFSELSDTITIKNWFNTNNRIETIMFSDGSTISASTLIPLQGTNEDDTTHLLDATSSVTLDLQEGNDTLTTSSGNDTLIGGRGNDTLNGGAGNDIYVFNKGDGIDTIVDTNGMDVLRFGEGISRGSLIIHAMGTNLVIGLKEDGIAFENLTDKVTLVNWYKTANRIENFHFSDGTIVGSELATEFIGTDFADIMTTSDSGEAIQGLDGDDTITALAGDDTLIGGKGNDTLQGGTGNDVYSFNRGDGSDIVIETSGNDTLAFMEGIIPDDLIAQVSGNDLIIALKEDGKTFAELSDKVTISNWYNANSRIETIAFSDGSGLNTTSAILGLLTTNEDDTITGTEQPDTINGGNGSDTINAGNGNDTLYGGTGNDILVADNDNTIYQDVAYADTLIGGKDNDVLYGGAGDDTYIFNRNDGKDIIYDYDLKTSSGGYVSAAFNAGNDTLKFGEGITSDDLIIKASSSSMDLIVALKEDGINFTDLSDQITIVNWFKVNERIENFAFVDGTILNIQQIINMQGTDNADSIHLLDYNTGTTLNLRGGNDIVSVTNGNDVIYAGDGDDTISGGNGNDSIYGGNGNDTLIADANATYKDPAYNDILIGGLGNDSLQAGAGDDTYIFNRGDGVDVIYDNDQLYSYYNGYYNAGNDTLNFGEEIIADDLIAKVSGNNLIIALKEEGKTFAELSNKITITDWYNSNNRIENISFSDGVSLTINGILNLISTDSDDVIRGTEQSESFAGGKGNDVLHGGDGNDTYLFNRGDGIDIISDTNGIDTLQFGVELTSGDILIKQVGNDLVVALKEEGKTFDELSDKVTITNWSYNQSNYPESWQDYNSRYGIENFVFADGMAWTRTDIITHIGTDEDDVIYGLDDSDTLSGRKGNDTLYGRGNDDTYLFNRGDGKDTIYDEGQYDYYGDNDRIQLGNEISANDVILQKDGTNLVIALKEDGVEFDALVDTITIQNWFNPYTRIEHLFLSDGSEIDLTYLLNPSEENDYLIYGSEDDIVNALGGNDEIYTNDGDDTIAGSTGEDTLSGGYGNDTYVFNRGDGEDWIIDEDTSYTSSANIDTIRFGEGITQDDLIVSTDWSGMSRQEKVLTIALKEEGVSFEDLADKISISNWDYQTIERIEFNDGTTLSLDEIIALQATNQDDIIIGTNYDDALNGNAGNDTLYGFDNDDVLVGGIENDTLNGGYGNDTYIFNRGDGQDTIYDEGSNSYYGGEGEVYYGGEGEIATTSGDTLQFGEDITIDDIEVQVQNGNLLIALKEDGKEFEELRDIITISNWESNYYSNAVETIQLADGTTYNIAEYFNLTHSENYYGEASPIVLDLNGNGITSTPSDNNTVYFDYNADGLRERTGWLERGDALLAVDVNHDGRINDGSELFGDHTKLPDGSNATDGYTAMLQYDSNADGKIDSTDERFNDLLLWKDTNLDGQSSVDELSTLSANGIESIDLGSNPLNIAENGNRISYETSFSMTSGVEGIVRDLWFKTAGDDAIKSTDGEMAETGSFSDSFDDFTTDMTLEIDSIKSFTDSGIGSLTLQSRYTGSGLDGASAQTVFEGIGYTGTLSNVWLKSDTLDTQYTYNGTLSDDVKALPSIDGQGNVINLQEAMNEKSELASSVTEFQNLSETGNLADFEANIDAIIEGWALYDLGGESANSTPPIVLDLDGDGTTSTLLSSSSAYFDYDGDGRREHTAWSDSGDALLSIDLDDDGVITHGAELFGNYAVKADGTKATDGYDAMAQYDTNGDNVLNSSDEQFSQLRLWKDLNQNGKNDAGELSTLAEEGISAINLSRTDGTTFTQITEEGNTITQETNYAASSGDGVVRDVWFSYDGTDTIAYSNLSDSDEKKIAIVENFYGRRLNSEERNSVEVIAEVLNQYNALRYDTIAKIITDKLYGEGFPNCQFLHDALNNTLGRVVGGAASTTETLLAVNLLAALLKREHVGVLADIYPEYFSNPTIAGLLAQSNIAIGFEEGALIGHIGNRYFGTSSAETLDFSALDGVRAYMSGGDDTIIGTNGIDEIVGGEGNDTLDGKSGNDILEGGQGDDILMGAATQNVYRYAWGDGNDTIIDAGSDDNAPDTLRFSDLDISRVSIERIGDDMIIHVCDEEGELLTPFDEPFGTITIKEGYSSGKIEHFYFGDSRYTFDEVLAYVPADTDYYFVRGDAHISIDEKGGDDTLHFGEGITKENIIARIIGNDLIIALAQEGRTFDTLSDKITILNYTDAIEHFTFDDGSTMELSEMVEFAQAHLKITGSDESETLYGTAEGETFNARAGDDTIYGEEGDDTYTFGLGDGSDTIVDTAGEDTILLKEGISANDVTLSLDGEDLIVSLSDGSEIRAVSWLSTTGRIEHIKDAQGISVDFSSVLKPVVENTAVEGDEDTLLEGSINVTDMSGTLLTYAITTDAQYGTVELNNETGEWTYTPNANFNGDDSVVVSVTNGYGVTSTSTITLNIASVNDAPIIDGADSALTLRNVLTSEGQINARDVDGDTLTYSIETQASHGTLSVDDSGKWLYTTVDGYDGQDSAIIRVSDGNGGSMDQTLNFTIIDNSAPEAPLESTNTLQDIRILNGEVGATDIDGNTLSYTVSTEASHGILSVDENGKWNYSAADGYMGDDTAVITIDDANGGVITQTLNFNVQVSTPSLANTTINLFEDTSSMGMLDVLNPIGGVLVYEVLEASTKGVFAFDEQGNWNYNPTANLNGEDSVTIKVTNEYGLSSTATLNLAIEAVNDTPVTSEQENYILQDIRIMNGVIEASDVDGDALEYTIHMAPVHGEIHINAEGEWNYTPAELSMGEDSAIISISDGHGGLVTKTITFDNRVSIPSISLDSLTLSEDTPRVESVNVMNPVGGVLSFEVVDSPHHGTISVNEQGVLEYTPSLNYHGSDSVALKVTNIYGLSDTRTIVLDILSVNDNPEAPAEISNTLQDIRILSGEVGATDIDGDFLTYAVSAQAAHGTLSVDTNGVWSYSAADGYMGEDSAIVTIDDNNGGIITQTLNFNVRVSAPTLSDSTSALLEDTPISGALSVINPIGGTLVYEILKSSMKGTFDIDAQGNWSYDPALNVNGDDSVTIKVTNEYGLSSTASLNLAIEAVNDAPVATSEEAFVLQDIRVQSGAVEATDVENDILTYRVSTAAEHGTLSVNEAGEWSYSAAEGYMGTDSAIITIDDSNGGVITQTLNFDVKVSAPTLSDSTVELLEDDVTFGTLDVVNPVGGVLRYEIINEAEYGYLNLDDSGVWIYVPDRNKNGNDSVSIKVTNAYGLSTTATLNLAIEAVNDAPILTETPEPKTLLAGASTTGNIKATDVDGDVLSYNVTINPEHGTLTINEQGEYTYTAERYYAGNSSATVNVSDGHGGSVATTLNFTNLMTPDWHYTYGGETLTINDNDGTDVLLMNDISMSDLTFLQEGNNLRIDVKDKNDVILTDYFTSPTKGVESIQTTEGSINLSKEKIGSSGSFFGIKWGSDNNDLIIGSDNQSDILLGQNGNDSLFGKGYSDLLYGNGGNDLLIGGDNSDTLNGEEGDDILYGDNGNDSLNGDAGNDKLFGGEGNDIVHGGEGNDILHGGKGNNTLIGNTGNDTYLATKGANNTTINENVFGFNLFGHYFGEEGGNDTLLFGEGITKEDISFLMRGNDLLLQYGDNEFITINNQKSEANRIEKLQLDDGSYLTNSDMDQIIQQINAYAKDHGFHLKDNTQIQNNQALMNIVAAGWHTA